MENIKDFIIAYVEHKGKMPENIDLDAFDFVKSGYIDSIAMFKFVVELEEEFDIEISDEEMMMPQLATIGGLTSFISEKIEGRG